jgi:hypothetical protein
MLIPLSSSGMPTGPAILFLSYLLTHRSVMGAHTGARCVIASCVYWYYGWGYASCITAIVAGIIAARTVSNSLILVDKCYAVRNCSSDLRLASVDRQLTGLSLSSGLSVKNSSIVFIF